MRRKTQRGKALHRKLPGACRKTPPPFCERTARGCKIRLMENVNGIVQSAGSMPISDAALPVAMKASAHAFDEAVRAVRAGGIDADEASAQLIGLLTDKEQLRLLDGDSPRRLLPFIPALLGRRPFVAGAVSRLGIPGIRFSDGARGVVIGAATAFPVTMARAATWDPALEERVGVAIGAETRARGANYSASVCEPAAASRLGSRAGVLRRRSGARRADGLGPHSRRSGTHDGVCEAFRAQLDGERTLRGRRLCRRPCAP